jgi:hypothetical protein
LAAEVAGQASPAAALLEISMPDSETVRSTKVSQKRNLAEDIASASPQSTHDRLRAFEDKHLGEDHLRPNGQIEKGIGSIFSRLDPMHRAHHAALEALIEAETEHQKASTAEAAAHARLEAAVKRVAETEEAL